MDAGRLNERIEILALDQREQEFSWKRIDRTWAQVEMSGERNLYEGDNTNPFASAGAGAELTRFLLRRRGLTPHHAIRWQGRHYLITGVALCGRNHLEAVGVCVQPAACIARRPTAGKDSLKRPLGGTEEIARFPAAVAEERREYRPQSPMARAEAVYTLTTPKAVQLREGDLVEVDGVDYHLTAVHLRGEYQNEYEIRREWDL